MLFKVETLKRVDLLAKGDLAVLLERYPYRGEKPCIRVSLAVKFSHIEVLHNPKYGIRVKSVKAESLHRNILSTGNDFIMYKA